MTVWPASGVRIGWIILVHRRGRMWRRREGARRKTERFKNVRHKWRGSRRSSKTTWQSPSRPVLPAYLGGVNSELECGWSSRAVPDSKHGQQPLEQRGADESGELRVRDSAR